MNVKFYSHKIVVVVMASMLGYMLSGPTALAGEPGVPAETVKFSDLNLDSSEGVTVLYRRIHLAAKQVCNADEGRSLAERTLAVTCVDASMARAVTKATVGGLTAMYQAKTGRPIATLAANFTK